MSSALDTHVTNAVVAHFAEDLSAVLELAETNSSYAIYDQDALQYFAARKFRFPYMYQS